MASDWEQSLFLLDMPSISRQDLSHMCKGPPEMMTSRSQNTLFLHSLLVSSRVARAAVSCSHELYFQEWSPQPFYSTYSWLPFLFCSSPFICRHRLNLWCVRCISCQQTWLAFLRGLISGPGLFHGHCISFNHELTDDLWSMTIDRIYPPIIDFPSLCIYRIFFHLIYTHLAI